MPQWPLPSSSSFGHWLGYIGEPLAVNFLYDGNFLHFTEGIIDTSSAITIDERPVGYVGGSHGTFINSGPPGDYQVTVHLEFTTDVEDPFPYLALEWVYENHVFPWMNQPRLAPTSSITRPR